VAIDTSLMSSKVEEPEWFVALAGERDVRLEPFALLEVPYALVATPSVAEADHDAAAMATEELGRAEARARAAEQDRDRAIAAAREYEKRAAEEHARAVRAERKATGEVEELALLRERAATLSRSLDEREQADSRRAKTHGAAEAELRGQVEAARRELASLRSEAAALREKAEARPPSPELGPLRERVAALEGERATLQAATRERIAVLEGERGAGQASLRARIAELEAERTALGAKLSEREASRAAAVSAAEQAAVAEGAALEAQLVERGRVVRELTHEVARHARLVKDLIAELDEAREAAIAAAGPTGEPEPDAALAELQSKLDRMASEAARREADLTAAKWRIGELERKVSRTDGTEAPLGR
jgi:hypothetical protein